MVLVVGWYFGWQEIHLLFIILISRGRNTSSFNTFSDLTEQDHIKLVNNNSSLLVRIVVIFEGESSCKGSVYCERVNELVSR